MELPESLSAWRDWLLWFAPDLAPAVGELVCRIHPILGGFRGQRQGDEPEPDGLGDLRRRGSYDRLLSSEWLLAQEIPDEFLRRAANGEHLFLAPRQRAKQAEKLIVALFDAGPLQLGSSRLAHLALWILLARRAREIGGEFRWGVLQSNPMLYEAETAHDLRKLLRARTYAVPNEANLAAWEGKLKELDAEFGELWLIGCSALPEVESILATTHVVRLVPSLNGENLEVIVLEKLSKRRVTLNIPPTKAAIRLLKGQFIKGETAEKAKHQPSPHRLSISLAPLVSWQGNCVAVPMLDESGAMVFPIPKREHQKNGNPRRQQWPAGSRPLAACLSGKSLGAMFSDSAHLHFWRLSRLRNFVRPPREVFEAPPGLAYLLPSAWLSNRSGEQFFVIDLKGRLLYWEGNSTNARSEGAHCFATNVLGLVQVSQESFVYVCIEDERAVVHRVSLRGQENWFCQLGVVPSGSRALFGAGLLWQRSFGICAVRMEAKPNEKWKIFTPATDLRQTFDTTEVILPGGCQAIGLLHEPAEVRFGLLALHSNSNSIMLYANGRSERLYTAPTVVAKITVCGVNSLIAMLTSDRQLIIYSAQERIVKLIIDGTNNDHATD